MRRLQRGQVQLDGPSHLRGLPGWDLRERGRALVRELSSGAVRPDGHEPCLHGVLCGLRHGDAERRPDLHGLWQWVREAKPCIPHGSHDGRSTSVFCFELRGFVIKCTGMPCSLLSSSSFAHCGGARATKTKNRFHSPGNVVNCTACAAGQFSQPRAEACSACDAGKFAPDAEASACLSCAAGTAAVGEGATLCVPCPAGQFQVRFCCLW